MARYKKKFGIVKTIGTYEKNGEEKKKYARIGDLIQLDDDSFIVEIYSESNQVTGNPLSVFEDKPRT